MKLSSFWPALAGVLLPLTAQEEAPAPAEPAAAEARAAEETAKAEPAVATADAPAETAAATAPEQPAEAAPAEQAAEPAVATAEEPATASAPQPVDTPQAAYRGIVKVEVAHHIPDFETPWNAGDYLRGSGTGFMVAPGRFLTNAHVVSNAERIFISPYGDARKIPAKVKFIAHDADLALLEVEDPSLFDGIPCLRISETMPQLEDTVRAIGFPVGGERLSVTRGIVSRIDMVPYSHSGNSEHLAVQIDAAINPGNSGGPVLKGSEVVGVAFQGLRSANATGYMIPVPVIRHFLRDIEDGHYDGYVDLGTKFDEAVNPALRRRCGLAEDGIGCLVTDIAEGGSASGGLQVGDIVLAVEGHPVDNSAMITIDGARVPLEELAERSFKGDVLHFDLLRKGERLQTEVKLDLLPQTDIIASLYDVLPCYVIFGGLVFQPLSPEVLDAHELERSAYEVELDDYISRGGFTEREELILLTDTLRDEINARVEESSYGNRLVKKVNGEPVRSLKHLYSLLYPAEGTERPPFTVIELEDASSPIVLDNAAIDAANARIKASYNIPEAARLNP